MEILFITVLTVSLLQTLLLLTIITLMRETLVIHKDINKVVSIAFDHYIKLLKKITENGKQ